MFCLVSFLVKLQDIKVSLAKTKSGKILLWDYKNNPK